MKVAVYGSLREGLGNHRLLAHVDSYDVGLTAVPFTMYSLGGFPAIVPNEDGSPVVVEVYEVDDHTFKRLDMLEGYTSEEDHWYNRKVVDVNLLSGETVQAWIYFFDDASGLVRNEVVAGNDWYKYITNSTY